MNTNKEPELEKNNSGSKTKITLGKIIGGHYKLSSGNIFLNNNLIKKWSSKIALDNGIAMIHQELA